MVSHHHHHDQDSGPGSSADDEAPAVHHFSYARPQAQVPFVPATPGRRPAVRQVPVLQRPLNAPVPALAPRKAAPSPPVPVSAPRGPGAGPSDELAVVAGTRTPARAQSRVASPSSISPAREPTLPTLPSGPAVVSIMRTRSSKQPHAQVQTQTPAQTQTQARSVRFLDRDMVQEISTTPSSSASPGSSGSSTADPADGSNHAGNHDSLIAPAGSDSPPGDDEDTDTHAGDKRPAGAHSSVAQAKRPRPGLATMAKSTLDSRLLFSRYELARRRWSQVKHNTHDMMVQEMDTLFSVLQEQYKNLQARDESRKVVVQSLEVALGQFSSNGRLMMSENQRLKARIRELAQEVHTHRVELARVHGKDLRLTAEQVNKFRTKLDNLTREYRAALAKLQAELELQSRVIETSKLSLQDTTTKCTRLEQQVLNMTGDAENLRERASEQERMFQRQEEMLSAVQRELLQSLESKRTTSRRFGLCAGKLWLAQKAVRRLQKSLAEMQDKLLVLQASEKDGRELLKQQEQHASTCMTALVSEWEAKVESIEAQRKSSLETSKIAADCFKEEMERKLSAQNNDLAAAQQDVSKLRAQVQALESQAIGVTLLQAAKDASEQACNELRLSLANTQERSAQVEVEHTKLQQQLSDAVQKAQQQAQQYQAVIEECRTEADLLKGQLTQQHEQSQSSIATLMREQEKAKEKASDLESRLAAEVQRHQEEAQMAHVSLQETKQELESLQDAHQKLQQKHTAATERPDEGPFPGSGTLLSRLKQGELTSDEAAAFTYAHTDLNTHITMLNGELASVRAELRSTSATLNQVRAQAQKTKQAEQFASENTSKNQAGRSNAGSNAPDVASSDDPLGVLMPAVESATSSRPTGRRPASRSKNVTIKRPPQRGARPVLRTHTVGRQVAPTDDGASNIEGTEKVNGLPLLGLTPAPPSAEVREEAVPQDAAAGGCASSPRRRRRNA